LTDFSDYSITSRGEATNAVSQSPFYHRHPAEEFPVYGIIQPEPERSEPADSLEEQQRRNETARADRIRPRKGVPAPREWRRFPAKTLAFPNFSHSLEQFSGIITSQRPVFVLQSLTAEMGSGKMQGNGHVILKNSQIQASISISSAKKCPLSDGQNQLAS